MPGRLAAAALAFALLWTALGVGAPAQDADRVAGTLAKLDVYFETYHVALGRLVADERLVQTVGGANPACPCRHRWTTSSTTSLDCSSPSA